MESTGRERRRKRKGAVKRGERGSCQMQMTSLGEGGCVTGGSLVYFFHSESTPSSSLLSLCVTAGVGNVKGRTKTNSLSSPGLWPHRTPPHLQKAEPTRRPSKSEAEHTQTVATFFFVASINFLNSRPVAVSYFMPVISCLLKPDSFLIHHVATLGVTLFRSCFLHTCILIYQELFWIQILYFLSCQRGQKWPSHSLFKKHIFILHHSVRIRERTGCGAHCSTHAGWMQE